MSGFSIRPDAYTDLEEIWKTPLWILAIIHGRRNPRVMAAMLRHRHD